MPYWYWYRQTNPQPPAKWVVCGPYENRDAALSDRQRDKRDGQVGVPFFAETKREAEEKTAFQ